MKKKRVREREKQVLMYLLEKEVATSRDVSNSLFMSIPHSCVTLLKLLKLGFVSRKPLKVDTWKNQHFCIG